MGRALKVAVIIPAYNEEKVIEACARSLKNQGELDYEVHIVDDESKDRTWDLLQSLQEEMPDRLKVYQLGKLGPGRIRNYLSRKLDVDILAFMDADCEAQESWLQNLIAPFEDPYVASVGGPHIAPNGSNDFQKRVEGFFKQASSFISFFKKSRDRIQATDHNPLCNVAYRRDVFLKFGGFREDLFPGEDYEFDTRLRKEKYQILYHPHAKVFHHRPEHMQDFRKVMHAYGRAQGKLVRERGPHRLLHHLAILILCAPLALTALPLTWEYRFAAIALCYLFLFFFRAPSYVPLSLWINSMDWFRGFIQGFITKKSPPPGSAFKESEPSS